MNIPKRFEHAKIEDIPIEIQELVKAMPKSKKGLFIQGGIGSGKSHICWSIIKEMQDKDIIECQFYDIPELLMFLKEDMRKTYGVLDETNLEQILNFKGLLFLDDLGVSKSTEWSDEVLYSIINSRYNNFLPTIYTSNLTLEELSGKIGDRLVSRIVGSCVSINLSGEDRRVG